MARFFVGFVKAGSTEQITVTAQSLHRAQALINETSQWPPPEKLVCCTVRLLSSICVFWPPPFHSFQIIVWCVCLSNKSHTRAKLIFCKIYIFFCRRVLSAFMLGEGGGRHKQQHSVCARPFTPVNWQGKYAHIGWTPFAHQREKERTNKTHTQKKKDLERKRRRSLLWQPLLWQPRTHRPPWL